MKKYLTILLICLFGIIGKSDAQIILQNIKQGIHFYKKDIIIKGDGANNTVSTTQVQSQAGITFSATATTAIKDSEISAKTKMIFQKGEITFDNVTLKCDEIIFESGVTKITVFGNVNINCKNVTIQNDGTALSIKKGDTKKASLQVKYSNVLNNSRKLEIDATDDFDISL